MAEIIGFNGPEAAWRLHEEVIRGWVHDLGYGPQVADWVVEDVKQRDFQLQHVSRLNWDSIPEEARPHLADISHGFKEQYGLIMFGWLAQVVKIECELWAAKFAEKG